MNNNDYVVNGMNTALSIAKCTTNTGRNELPVGCAIYVNKKLSVTAYNKTNAEKDPLAHCEYICITELLEKNILINSIDIFITLEPCCMCYRVIEDLYCLFKKEFSVYFGVYNYIFGMTTVLPELIGNEFNYICVNEEESIKIIKEFYKQSKCM